MSRGIELPPIVASGDLLVIASVSGGKDSTALLLALKEAGVVHRAVFADTAWEADETYAYLELLRDRVCPIDVVAGPGMVAEATRKAGFPMRTGRWCTETLKVMPLRAYHDKASEEDGRDTVSAIGIRAEESAKRAAMPPFEDADNWGGHVWRPLLAWTIEDVISIHHRHDVPLNPLYLRGHNRVGCYPCIFSQKEEVRLIAEHAPERIAEIRAMESAFTVERARRNAEGSGKFRFPTATFFAPIVPTVPNGIDEIVNWSRTTHGGRQLSLLQPEPEGGCFRWGMCEPPAKESDE